MHPYSDQPSPKFAFCCFFPVHPKGPTLLMPALHGPHIQNKPQSHALALTSLPSSFPSTRRARAALLRHLLHPTCTSPSALLRPHPTGALTVALSPPAAPGKKIWRQGMGRRQPLSPHCHRGTQPSFTCRVGSTSALSHPRHGPHQCANSFSKHPP